jgi:hypothetical protein
VTSQKKTAGPVALAEGPYSPARGARGPWSNHWENWREFAKTWDASTNFTGKKMKVHIVHMQIGKNQVDTCQFAFLFTHLRNHVVPA